jgi:hypothetical protein
MSGSGSSDDRSDGCGMGGGNDVRGGSKCLLVPNYGTRGKQQYRCCNGDSAESNGSL